MAKKNKFNVEELDKTVRRTAQDTIPIRAIIDENGIFEIRPKTYSRSWVFSDINYQIASEPEQEVMYDKYSELLNSFDPSVGVQITINNRNIDRAAFEQDVLIREVGDELDELRREYNQELLLRKIREGKNSIKRERYITLTIRAKNSQEAITAFERLDSDLVASFKKLGAECRPLKTKDRLQVLHDIYNIGSEEYFSARDFSLKTMYERGVTANDYIAPSVFDFKNNFFKIGDKYARSLVLKDMPTLLHDNILADLTNVDFNMLLSISVRPVASEKAFTLVKNQMVSVNASVVDAQKRASRAGFSGDLISPALKQAQEEASEMYEDLTQRNQKLFIFTMAITLFADSMGELNSETEAIRSISRKHMCMIKPLTWQQEAGLNASVPIGVCNLTVNRPLTSESAGIFVPFTSQELYEPGGMYYGQNAISRNLILYNRTSSKNYNGFILGVPGSGKSFAAKREMLNVLLSSDSDLIVIDPESEYAPMASLLGGEIIRLKSGGDVHINPMDMSMLYSSEDGSDPLALKSDFILSIFETVIGGRLGINPIQKSIIDRAVRNIYTEYLRSGRKEDLPTLVTLQEDLKKQASQDSEARELAIALELYTMGSLRSFAEHSNVNTQNRFIVYDVRDLGQNLKTLGLQIVLDNVWNRLCENRSKGKRTWFYIDEIYLLFANEYSANFLQQIWKRARKYGGVPTGITQNVEDILRSDTARTMLSNSDFVMMLNQAPLDAAQLAELLHISAPQLSYVTNADPGQGLLYVSGRGIIPFIDRFPTDTKMYKAMDSRQALRILQHDD